MQRLNVPLGMAACHLRRLRVGDSPVDPSGWANLGERVAQPKLSRVVNPMIGVSGTCSYIMLDPRGKESEVLSAKFALASPRAFPHAVISERQPIRISGTKWVPTLDFGLVLQKTFILLRVGNADESGSTLKTEHLAAITSIQRFSEVCPQYS